MNMRSWLTLWLGRAKSQPKSEATTESIAADVPIRSASEDLLRRVPFAKRIADVLAVSSIRDGRVFAIRGAWGYGKSSLKNLVIEHLAGRTPTPQWLELNPWQWGDSATPSHAHSSLRWRPSWAVRIRHKRHVAPYGNTARYSQVQQERCDRLVTLKALQMVGECRACGCWHIGIALPNLPVTTIAATRSLSQA
jgi:KAP family P-loop domain